MLPGVVRVLEAPGGEEKIHVMHIEQVELGVEAPADFLTGASSAQPRDAAVAAAAR